MSRRDAGPEGGEVATEHLGARLGGVVLLGLVESDEPALGPPVPERGLVVMEEMRTQAGGAPGTARLDALEPVLLLEVGDRVRRGHGTRGGQRARRRGETLRDRRLRREIRLVHRRPDECVVLRGDEVERSRIAVALITVPRASSRSSAPRRKPVARVQTQTYGARGHCACIPTRRSTIAVGERRLRSSRSWRARVARFSSRSVRTRSATRARYTTA